MPETELNVVLLKYTQNPEETVSHAAKLCYSSATIDELKTKVEKSNQEKFIRKLITIGHTSPFEHVSFTFGAEGISRACSHQLVRHRLASYSQQSQRYVGAHSKEDSKEANQCFNYIVPPGIKQAGKEEWFSGRMMELQHWYDELVTVLKSKCDNVYEDARFILPNAIETKIVITMNARELLHFFNVRCCNRAQWEIRGLATEMLRLIKPLAPNIFVNAGPSCVNGKCHEGDMACGKMKEVVEKFKWLRF
ncbi:MAG: FAD-dependent thymidylate synthase [Candidatus Anammoxibacter sp.]